MKYRIYIFSKQGIKKYHKKAAEEYMRRLSRYCGVSLTVVKKEKDWDKYLAKEKDRIYVVPGPDQMTSEVFSDWLGECEMKRGGSLAFFIPQIREDGGEYETGETIHLSSFDMEAGMTGLVLVEQIYRGYRILHHHPYHK